MTKSPLTVRAICEGALELIGAYSVHQTGADANELRRAADWLDDMLKHTHGRQRNLWLVRQGTITLTANAQSYNLISALGTDAPPDGFLIPISAYYRDGSNDAPIDIIRMLEYDNIERKDDVGDIEVIAIDRLLPTPTLYVHRVPEVVTGKSIKLRFATFNPDPTGKALEDRRTGLPATWSLWAKYCLASIIGDGPVRKIRDDEVKGFKERAEELYGQLVSFDDQEHANEPRRTEPWGL